MFFNIIKLIIGIIIGLAAIPIVIALYESEWTDHSKTTIDDEIDYLEAVKKNRRAKFFKKKRDKNKVK